MSEKISFDEYINKFKSGEMYVHDWNFCKSKNNKYDIDRGLGNYTAYIMGCGAEQCLANKCGFSSVIDIEDLYDSICVEHSLWI